MIEILFICLIFGIFIIYSFLKGIQIGQKIIKNETVEIKNPVKIVQKQINDKTILKEEQKQREIDEINLYNIENYNGSSNGQKDFPNEMR